MHPEFTQLGHCYFMITPNRNSPLGPTPQFGKHCTRARVELVFHLKTDLWQNKKKHVLFLFREQNSVK